MYVKRKFGSEKKNENQNKMLEVEKKVGSKKINLR